ncbi:GNAT family N-acetyltransferase [Curtobacterium flaccumfaciens]|uniref:GNAT family N-acetyltransferase n=1 Tax=Curtobacterium flaccumfaciens TaxID=2035 RepID=UPI0039A342E4
MIHVFERAEDLDPSRWDSIERNRDVALSHSGLMLAEQTAGAEMRYIVVTSEAGAWVGGLPAAKATSEARWILGRPDALLKRAIESHEPGSQEALTAVGGSASHLLPTLVLGGRHMGNSAMLLSDDAPADTANLLLDVAEDVAKSLQVRAMSAPFVSAANDRFRRSLTQASYVPFGINRYSSLALPDGGYDAWVTQFSKKKRWKIRDERRRISAAGFTSRVSALSSADLQQLAGLETQLLRKYGHDWRPEYSVAALGKLVATFGADAMVSTVERGPESAGFVVLLRNGDRWSARQVGFDYEMQGDLPLYFETLFYAPVGAASAHGVRHIDFGLGSEEAKVSRGCVTDTQQTWVKSVGA